MEKNCSLTDIEIIDIILKMFYDSPKKEIPVQPGILNKTGKIDDNRIELIIRELEGGGLIEKTGYIVSGEYTFRIGLETIRIINEYGSYSAYFQKKNKNQLNYFSRFWFGLSMTNKISTIGIIVVIIIAITGWWLTLKFID